MPPESSDQASSTPAGDARPSSVVRELRRLALQQAGDLAQLARESGEQALIDGKTRAAQQLFAVSGAVRRAADKLHDQDNDALAEYVDGAAKRVGDIAQQIKEQELADLARGAEMLARKKPLLFLGGLFVVGLAAAQVIKVVNRTTLTDPDAAEPDKAQDAKPA